MSKFKLFAIALSLFLTQAPRAGAQEGPEQPANQQTSVFESAYATASTLSAPSVGCTVDESRAAHPDHRKHDGFFLRMMGGLGVGGSKYRDNVGLAAEREPSSTRTLGGSAMGEVAVGFSVFENFALHATLNLNSLAETKIRGRNDRTSDEIATVMGFFGGGATYYFMPVNMYLTGSVGVGGLSQTNGTKHQTHESNTGFGTSFAIGKEWWLGRSGQWGMGVALTGSYYQAPLDIAGVKSTYRGHATGLAFTTTYN